MSADRDPPTTNASLVIFDRDFRLSDNRALTHAVARGPVLPVYVYDDDADARLGGAQKWWLHHSLSRLHDALGAYGGGLTVLRENDRRAAVTALCRDLKIERVFWNARVKEPGFAGDDALGDALNEAGIECEAFDGQLLHDPDAVKTGSGGHYRVYTPFWRALEPSLDEVETVSAPDTISFVDPPANAVAIDSLALLPTDPDWAGGIAETWTPGEDGAWDRLQWFLDNSVNAYDTDRDRPDREATSRQSPHLAFA